MGCPDYYKLADGRQFAEFSEELAGHMETMGVGAWEIHCLISSYEHLFRMGAKEGEAETDAQSFAYWFNQVTASRLSGHTGGGEGAFSVVFGTLKMVLEERAKVGR